MLKRSTYFRRGTLLWSYVFEPQHTRPISCTCHDVSTNSSRTSHDYQAAMWMAVRPCHGSISKVPWLRQCANSHLHMLPMCLAIWLYAADACGILMHIDHSTIPSNANWNEGQVVKWPTATNDLRLWISAEDVGFDPETNVKRLENKACNCCCHHNHTANIHKLVHLAIGQPGEHLKNGEHQNGPANDGIPGCSSQVHP